MKRRIEDYATLVFDCDGVVLCSNKVKTEAFFKTALPFGEAPARALVDYHVANGGISRYKKFAYFIDQILPSYLPDGVEASLDILLDNYASTVRLGLLKSEVAPGLQSLREKTPDARWLIVSGGDQEELRDVFTQRGLADYFNGGIFGSPDTKDEILARELDIGNIHKPALFLGDSKYDFKAAAGAGLDFIFLSKWSEVSEWDQWVEEHGLSHRSRLSDL